jgi:hypothetical protein
MVRLRIPKDCRSLGDVLLGGMGRFVAAWLLFVLSAPVVVLALVKKHRHFDVAWTLVGTVVWLVATAAAIWYLRLPRRPDPRLSPGLA